MTSTDTDTLDLRTPFNEWIDQEPKLKLLASDPETRSLLEQVFMTGASVGTELQAAASAENLAVAIAQRDFLDHVCASSTDPTTVHWRHGFEEGCPPQLIWPSRSGDVGVEGPDADPTNAEPRETPADG